MPLTFGPGIEISKNYEERKAEYDEAEIFKYYKTRSNVKICRINLHIYYCAFLIPVSDKHMSRPLPFIKPLQLIQSPLLSEQQVLQET